MKFRTISRTSESKINIKGSKFLGFAYPLENEEEVNTILASLRKKYYDATHHCYAWQVGYGKDMRFRYHDDGEPSGTAGKPIYMAVTHRELTNILVVSVRYFGGTKLGTGGLARAYGQSASLALDKAKTITVEKGIVLHFRSSYEQHPLILRALNDYHLISLSQDFGETVNIKAEVDEEAAPQIREKIKNATRGEILGEEIVKHNE